MKRLSKVYILLEADKLIVPVSQIMTTDYEKNR
jgi:hypothetical protein